LTGFPRMWRTSEENVSTCVDRHAWFGPSTEIGQQKSKNYGAPKNILAHQLPIRIQFSLH
jgi:hypothetical protein